MLYQSVKIQYSIKVTLVDDDDAENGGDDDANGVFQCNTNKIYIYIHVFLILVKLGKYI